MTTTTTCGACPRRTDADAGKYANWMDRVFGSAERFSSMCSVPLLFRATRIRGG